MATLRFSPRGLAVASTGEDVHRARSFKKNQALGVFHVKRFVQRLYLSVLRLLFHVEQTPESTVFAGMLHWASSNAIGHAIASEARCFGGAVFDDRPNVR